ncbi:hypothetical protein [Streptomyces flaveolus]|uniref:hypothetical protein n=1 Tax=Streptomyces flaveolus TaxID=67297 RepID=UPI001670AF6B|nr:hypothetical protein [Streptomyces flaveolus]GGQ81377.1 hypothetical protein GCM10010216_49050 [Streptomyces flaveolus]
MGDTERPIPERLGDQEEQAAHLTRTGNGPTVDDEQQLLAEVHGAPDMAGNYSRPEPVADQDDEPDPADEQPATDDTAKGGEGA